MLFINDVNVSKSPLNFLLFLLLLLSIILISMCIVAYFHLVPKKVEQKRSRLSLKKKFSSFVSSDKSLKTLLQAKDIPNSAPDSITKKSFKLNIFSHNLN